MCECHESRERSDSVAPGTGGKSSDALSETHGHPEKNTDLNDELMRMIRSSHDDIGPVLRMGASVFYRIHVDWTPLHLASFKGKLRDLSCLVY